MAIEKHNKADMATTERGRAYGYSNALPSHSQRYLSTPLNGIIARETRPSHAKALDYGCGNGWFANRLSGRGFNTTGVDISPSGIEVARRNFPEVTFSTDVSPESLIRLGPFHLITCIEVIAHCYRPAEELAHLYTSLEPGGCLVLSTPYHGYWKYLALAVTGRLETYLDTAWDGAYMHHFTPKSMRQLLENAGFCNIEITRVGRVPPLAKAMIVTCRKQSL